MNRLQIGRYLGVSLGLLAFFGIYQVMTGNSPDSFEPGQTEFRSLEDYRKAFDRPLSTTTLQAKFDDASKDDNQIQLPGTIELEPDELTLSPLMSLRGTSGRSGHA